MRLATAQRSPFLPLTPLKLQDFDYKVPKKLVAQYPAEPRDTARLMVVHRDSGEVEHRLVSDLPEYFDEGDALVANDTAVFPARLFAQKERTGARIEVFLVRELNPETRLWDVIVDPARKVRVGNKLYFEGGLEAEVIDNTTSRGRTLRFCFDGTPEALYDLIDEIGETPIPPYLRRPVEPEDRERYQTIFARERGAVAAPTAGLHFTPTLIERIKQRGTAVCTVTLHTGLGSFHPVEVEDLSKHRMAAESFTVTDAACGAVNAALVSPTNHVTVCCATTCRALESSLSAHRTLKAGSGWTDKFIYPPHNFVITERLLTNFQRPRSTLLMMVAAFAGPELLREAYEVAIKEEYRMFAFGDAMLVV